MNSLTPVATASSPAAAKCQPAASLCELLLMACWCKEKYYDMMAIACPLKAFFAIRRHFLMKNFLTFSFRLL